MKVWKFKIVLSYKVTMSKMTVCRFKKVKKQWDNHKNNKSQLKNQKRKKMKRKT